MIRAVRLSLGLLLVSQLAVPAQNPPTATEDAIAEGARRQVFKIELGQKLVDAQAAQKKGDNFAAAKLYEDCLTLIRSIGTGVEAELAQTVSGMTAVRLQLAEQAQRAGEYNAADDQVRRLLAIDPRNQAALAFKAENDKLRRLSEGRMPSQETISKLSAIYTNQVEIATLVQDGKLLYEAGQYDAAEKQLREAVRRDSSNQAAFYYLDKIKEERFRQESHIRDNWSREMILDVSRAWNSPVKREALPVPNPYARTNLVHTGKGRQAIYAKLDRIRINEFKADSLPLSEVINLLTEDVRKRDPEKKGINFLLNPNAESAAPAGPVVDPATGLPSTAPGVPQEGAPELGNTTVKIVPPLVDVTLGQVLDAIIKVATPPVKYSVEEYAIIFSARPAEPIALHTRIFKVDPNTFLQGLQGVTSFEFGAVDSGGGGGGGSRGGGGGSRGGGGGGSRGGGGGSSGSGIDGSGGGSSEYVGVSLIGGGGRRGQQGAQGAPGGGQAAGAQGGGVSYLTQETPTQIATLAVQAFFQAAGVNLAPPKSLFFNDRSGMLMVRGTMQDLDIIEQAIQVLNMSPPQLTIEAKFAEVTQDDTRALGFDWLVGNFLIGGGKLGAQPGTAPTYGGPAAASPANPSGFFPGPGIPPSAQFPNGLPGPGFVPPSTTDNLLTGGLRNSAPALATLTGILTDPQFRVVVRALEQREGVDLLSAPKITTLSARQAQIKVVDVRYIVTDLDLDQTSGGGGGTVAGTATTGGNGVVGSTIQPITSPVELGPVLDVVPYVSADGYTIQMTIIPTIKEFVGYDLDSAQLFQAQAQSVGGVGGASNPLTTTTPLPIFRLRQVVTSAVVWDGQTVVLGGLISENVMKTKDKVPVLGDLPIAGRLFRSESSSTQKKNLLIFVTPTIIDPAGNRVHSEDEMPFNVQAKPGQPPVNP